jgi:diaminohydroxyphosphoribosylaminopyrimidine deaminase/5-amino-6-(5-phosphoribosylamino)uracil reductase
MHIAARLAARGRGSVEPNPLVGCLIVSPTSDVVGWGYHRRYGGPHAEINALSKAGRHAKGATAYVTLEPCAHVGKTPPCTDALIRAGVTRVVLGRRDPNPVAAGGVARLRAAGVQVDLLHECDFALAVTDPFVHRVRSGLPWVIAKWAQTIDGRIATRSGESKWISSENSRRLVHRERGRVDAILTGIGTALADDPMLTARDVRVRRVARRVIVDPRLKLPLDSKLVQTAGTFPTMVACAESVLDDRAEHAAALRGFGVDVISAPAPEGEMRLAPVLRRLVEEHDATNVLVEGGAALLGRLFRQKLVKEAWVFIAPLLFGDEAATPCVSGLDVQRLTDGVRMRPISVRARSDDVVLRYRIDAQSD